MSTFRHSRAGVSPVELASVNRMPLDSRLRGNDECMFLLPFLLCVSVPLWFILGS